MKVGDYFNFLTGAGALLLLWAAFTARRSAFDAVLLVLAGLFLIFIGLRSLLAASLSLQIGMWPELAAALLALLFLIRAVFNRQGCAHRLGMGLVGLVMMLPLLPIIVFIGMWVFASGGGANRGPVDNGQVAANSAADPAPVNQAREQPR